jgi:hypothetical protein
VKEHIRQQRLSSVVDHCKWLSYAERHGDGQDVADTAAGLQQAIEACFPDLSVNAVAGAIERGGRLPDMTELQATRDVVVAKLQPIVVPEPVAVPEVPVPAAAEPVAEPPVQKNGFKRFINNVFGLV